MTAVVNSIEKNAAFVGIAILMMVAVYLIAFLFEKRIETVNRVRFSSEKTKVNKMVIMGMMTAISVILMYVDFPVAIIAPSFYRMDFSEIPILIGSFLLGPCAGVLMEAVKNILMVALKGTSTGFVGEFSNFILGCIYVVPAAVIYHYHKTRKRAIIGLLTGGLFLVAGGALMNAFYLLPKYAEMFGGSVDMFIKMGTAINPAIQNVFTLVALAVVPFNLIKALADGIIVIILYKYLSHLLKH